MPFFLSISCRINLGWSYKMYFFSWNQFMLTDRNKMKWIGLNATFVHIQAKLGQEKLLRMVRWHCPPDTVFETQTLEVCGRARSSRSRRLPTILSFSSGWGRNIFVSFKPPGPVNEPRTLACKAAVLTTTLGPPPMLTNVPACYSLHCGHTIHTKRWSNVDLMLYYRLRRWPNTKSTLVQCFMFAGLHLLLQYDI